MFEHHKEPLAPSHIFLSRVVKSFLLSMFIISFSLFIGMMGYHYIDDLLWIDAFVESAMISAGMGPIAPLHSFNAKLFAGFYALYSGLALIAAVGIIIAPIIHRFFHLLHVDNDGE